MYVFRLVIQSSHGIGWSSRKFEKNLEGTISSIGIPQHTGSVRMRNWPRSYLSLSWPSLCARTGCLGILDRMRSATARMTGMRSSFFVASNLPTPFVTDSLLRLTGAPVLRVVASLPAEDTLSPLGCSG